MCCVLCMCVYAWEGRQSVVWVVVLSAEGAASVRASCSDMKRTRGRTYVGDDADDLAHAEEGALVHVARQAVGAPSRGARARERGPARGRVVRARVRGTPRACGRARGHAHGGEPPGVGVRGHGRLGVAAAMTGAGGV